MEHLTNDVVTYLFGFMPLPDQRHFYRTSTVYKFLYPQLKMSVTKFFDMINKTEFVKNSDHKKFRLSNSNKFAVELIYYDYVHLLHQNAPINWLLSNCLVWTGCAERNLPNMLQKLIDTNDTELYRYIPLGAVCSNNFDLVKWAHNKNCPLSPTFALACEKGTIEMVEFCWNLIGSSTKLLPYIGLDGFGYYKTIDGVTESLDTLLSNPIYFESAAANPDIRILKWLCKKHFTWSLSVCSIIAANGYIDNLAWCIDNNLAWDIYDVCIEAVNSEQLDVLKWLDKHNYFNPFQFNIVTGNLRLCCKNYELIKWLCDKNCGLPQNICDVFASHNNLEMLKWAHRIGYRFDNSICKWPIKFGNVKMLRWLFRNGCERKINASFIEWTLIYCKPEIFRWACDKNFVMPNNMCDILIEHGRINLLKWYLKCYHKRYHCEVSNTMCKYLVKYGDFKTIMLLHKYKCDMPNICSHAATYGKTEIFKWAHINGYSIRMYGKIARLHGNDEIADYVEKWNWQQGIDSTELIAD